MNEGVDLNAALEKTPTLEEAKILIQNE